MSKGGYGAQSAMEYLMTYGWAILIIIIVLAVLYIIGVFTPSGILGNQCNVKFHYSCAGLALATNGTMSFLLGQNNGYDEYNVAVACTTATNSTGGPYPSGAWVYLNASGTPKTSYNSGSAYTLYSGTTLQVNNTPCYSDTGATLGSQPIGTAFTGILWVRYTTAPSPEGGLNSWVSEQIATPSVTVGKSGGGTTQSTTSAGSSTTSTTSTSTTSTTTVSAPTFLTGKATGNLPISDPLSGTFSEYVCAGAIYNKLYGSIAPNYSVDAEDYSTNTTATGTGTAFCGLDQVINCRNVVCEITPTGALATIGLAGASPNPTINKQALYPPQDASGASGTINYTISQPNSFVVLLASCGNAYYVGSTPCSVVWPAGCIQRQAAVDSHGDAAYVATCQSQADGTYYADITIGGPACAIPKFEVPLGSCYPASMEALVFANYTPTGS